MSVYFIGDLHLGHENIMKFGQRNFPSIEEHDEYLVTAWNSVVKSKRDLVWVLGDVAMEIESLKLMDKMVGRKVLVMGNHDRFDTQVYLKYFEKVVAFEKRYHGLVMTHIPIHPNEMNNRNWNYNLHGHIHMADRMPYDPQYINVNADAPGINLTPISLERIRGIIKEREEANETSNGN